MTDPFAPPVAEPIFGEVRFVEDISEEEWEMIQRHRREQEHHEAIRAAHLSDACETAALLSGTVWRAASGDEIPVAKMTPRHARNALRFAVKHVFNLQQQRALAGEPPSFACPDDWPLIHALCERGTQEDSIVDRLKDLRDARRYKKQQSAKR